MMLRHLHARAALSAQQPLRSFSVVAFNTSPVVDALWLKAHVTSTSKDHKFMVLDGSYQIPGSTRDAEKDFETLRIEGVGTTSFLTISICFVCSCSLSHFCLAFLLSSPPLLEGPIFTSSRCHSGEALRC